jgi:hypothetical protein
VQIDQAGNPSPAATAGTFAFVPTIVSPVNGSITLPRVVPLVVRGWAGESVLVTITGLAAQQSFLLNGSGELDLNITSSGGGILPAGFYTAVVRYGTGTPAVMAHFTIS